MTWQFNNLNVPMMEDEDGTLFTTGSVLSGVLGVTERNLRNVYLNHRDEFDGNCANDIGAISFLQQNRETFQLKYLRADMHVWSEDDMILFAALSNSDQGKEFRKGMKELVKQQARKSYVSREEYESLAEQLIHVSNRLEALEQERENVRPSLNLAASAAGVALAAQRNTKAFRS
jgi:BMFP domain-containing protein YqiC